ncbi:phosphatidate phosphatase PAH1-like isoform X2 [Solanum dulcamara]|uniref:phosphatidate phosphatase PAH1-like isoform X2 n=1 Tax=Solanum dulcamara TaxID=45834 RepID=UPI002485282D|nr:phosphatidate phosphatase PAH1-like isoform X2 [Solanum dulcamara]
MNVVGKVSSFITQGVYSVATPFHPFGGAVDIIVVKQHDKTFRSTPWHVRFGKFQGVLKGAEKVVRIEVNGVEADFHMYLDNSGEAYFIREVAADNENEVNGDSSKKEEVDASDLDNVNNNEGVKEGDDSNKDDLSSRDEGVTLGIERLDRGDSDGDRRSYEFLDEQSSLEDSVVAEFGSSRYEDSDNVEEVLESQNSSSEVVMVRVDGHILKAPILSFERNVEDVKLDTPRFHLGPGQGTDFSDSNSEFISGEATWADEYLSYQASPNISPADACDVKKESSKVEHQTDVSEVDGQFPVNVKNQENGNVEVASCVIKKDEVYNSCLELQASGVHVKNKVNQPDVVSPAKILEVVDDLEKKHPGKLGDNSSLNPSKTLPQGESATDSNGSDGSIDHPVVSDKPTEKQNDVSLATEELQSGQQEPDECTQCENMKRLIEAFLKVTGVEISLCGNLLHAGMGSSAAREAFDANRVSEEEFRSSAESIIKNENLVVRIRGNYILWDRAAPIILGMAECDMELPVECADVIPVEMEETSKSGEDDSGISSVPSGRRWTLCPNPFRRVKTLEKSNCNSSDEEVFVDSESSSTYQPIEQIAITQGGKESPREQLVRTNIPTSSQITSLNLKEGQNMVTFIFSTRVLGEQKVESHIYLWKWNAKIVISDVDGTITKSDVLGQFMPLVGKDWTHFGTARLFSAIKENGYQLLFLSARAIVQAYLTKNFLFNLKQDGKTLPTGPVVISPDGLFPSLYREVIRRAPHEFKIACLEDIKVLFPQDYNPFYAGFGNRDTDEFSYRKIGIPKGKIFIINPKGEVSINNQIDVKSYTSLHSLVDDMFPPTSMAEQEDYNIWNYWKMPISDINYL